MSSDRVREHTDDEVQAEIDAEAQRRVASLRGAPREALTRRLGELRREWDVERALEVNASTLILVSSVAAGARTRSSGAVRRSTRLTESALHTLGGMR